MLKNKKVNLIIFLVIFATISISSCGKLDHYKTPVYLNIINAVGINPANKSTGPNVFLYYKPAGQIYYNMTAQFNLETISVYEPALDSMKPKGVTLNKIVMDYYKEDNNVNFNNPSFTITEYVSLFVPVTEKEKTTTTSSVRMQAEEGDEKKGVTYSLVVGDKGPNRLFPSQWTSPRDSVFYWILRCTLYATDERGNEVTAKQYLYLNCNPVVYEEEK
ncbi:MAG: hypothetical protein QMD92_01075 [bacterium]|nr:hypothetical protein [bacterium]